MYFFRVMANTMTILHLEQIVADLKIIMCSTFMTEVAERASRLHLEGLKDIPTHLTENSPTPEYSHTCA